MSPTHMMMKKKKKKKRVEVSIPKFASIMFLLSYPRRFHAKVPYPRQQMVGVAFSIISIACSGQQAT